MRSPRSSTAATKALLLLLSLAAASVHGAAAADPDVCTLPASALYVIRAAGPSPSPAPSPSPTPARNATSAPTPTPAPTPAPAPSTRAACWSQGANAAVDGACFSACACRRIESETTANRTSRFVGVCISGSSPTCSGSGIANCSAYALNADGSSTLKTQAPGSNSSQTPAPTTRSPTAAPTPTPLPATPIATAAHAQSPAPTPSTSGSGVLRSSVPVSGAESASAGDGKKDGVGAWVWAVAAVGAVLVVALGVFAVNWAKHRPRYVARGGSERADSLGDSWKRGDLGPLREPLSASTTSTTPAAPAVVLSMSASASTSEPVSGVAGVGYDAYRVGSTPGYSRHLPGPEYDIDMMSDVSADAAPSPPAHGRSLGSSFSLSGFAAAAASVPAGRADNYSQISYATSDDESYRSRVDSFSSQLTLTELEARASDASSTQLHHSNEF